MNYFRVLPRDLFNEAKLLKCLGQLCLLIHDYDYPIKFEHDDGGFVIEQDQNDGGLYCTNLRFYVKDKDVMLLSQYNSKDSYPLLFFVEDEYYRVFDENGKFTVEFKWFIGQ